LVKSITVPGILHSQAILLNRDKVRGILEELFFVYYCCVVVVLVQYILLLNGGVCAGKNAANTFFKDSLV
jgi:hypothetical protein